MSMLEEALRLTAAMAEKAETADFESLEAFKSRRDAVLRQALAGEEGPRRERYAVLCRIRELDAQIVAVLERERDQAAAALRRLRSGHQAVSQYLASGA
ncbi:flagellar protein FliT [Methylomarinovum tepidoasis]|uniref:flagellar protein FliT n=1 Tax=Methylomarinovum tepidoasis TaxID=2840183 RepID=UPI0025732AD9|nr:flagellar protein FliT [Methylomarinovum sp. IN45]